SASLQFTIVEILMDKLRQASLSTGINEIAIAGGVAANSALRQAILSEAKLKKWKVFLPEPRYTTDNAAMIAITGYLKYLKGDFASGDVAPFARMRL
ncbi:MAG: tRNA (adenosine(37)-N6)-threonylcarbamoyltransferase complex transferase subunit TsaD, partial [Bacteroidia bacterium]|nr:tRNA (adenosine(37)-N6)-threonylcarbamoyltransferase complex transferase subunit TsaD [Bacteroidia bacterium]